MPGTRPGMTARKVSHVCDRDRRHALRLPRSGDAPGAGLAAAQRRRAGRGGGGGGAARRGRRRGGALRAWLLSDSATPESLAALAAGLTPEMAAAVAKIMSLQDLMVAAAKCRRVTGFPNTPGLAGRLVVRLQPNPPTDDAQGIAASILDGLLLGA